MKYLYKNIILSVLILSSYNVYSQINCTVPLPPLLTSVSVQPESGNTELEWTLSQSADIAAYIIYTYEDGDGMAIDTLWNPLATNYSYFSGGVQYGNESYVVASYRLPLVAGMDGCPSPLSNILTTIFTSAYTDTCNKKIVVSWNSYTSYPKEVIDYSVLWSVNGSSYTEAGNVNSGLNSFIIDDFITNSEYTFVVRANLEDGTVSTSNKANIITKMEKPPAWINADYATVNDDKHISLSFTIDPLSEITHFSLERKVSQSGTFEEIAQPVSVNGSVSFTDDQADINLINYYRLAAINNCNTPVTFSNISSNIVLSLERTGDDFRLSWNSYKEWLGLVSSYRLFIDAGRGFEEKIVLQPGDTVFSISYQDIMYDVSGEEICFYILASEAYNPNGISGQSVSSRVCSEPTVIITVPNVFTPNSGTINSYFKPVLSFVPLAYHLLISDRRGNILFETKDYTESWDGSRRGNTQTESVCLWYLKVTAPTGNIISRTGTITIINKQQ